MLKAVMKPEIRDLVEQRAWSEIRSAFKDWPAAEVADLLLDVESPERVLLFRALERDQAAGVFSHLEPEEQEALLADLRDEETRQLLTDLSPDDRTHVIEELPGNVTQRLLNLLSPEDQQETRELLGYPEESVGRLMTPEYVAVKAGWTISRALDHIRKRARRSETINRVYVVDRNWKLVDDIELRRLFLANPDSRVADAMDHNFVFVLATDDREDAAKAIQRYDIFALPVVDSSGVLVGMVTVDDLLDVVEEEATEDFHKGAAVAPLKTSYREAPIRMLYSRRVGWLLILVFINLISSGVIAAFEDVLEATIALAFFIPLLIDSGGNAGAQSATLMVRAIATGDLRLNQWMRAFTKELGVGVTLGVTMGLASGVLGVFRGGPEIGIVVGLAMVSIVIIANLIGAVLPFILTKIRVDPAVASSPLITSIADASGLLIYFTIATIVIGGL